MKKLKNTRKQKKRCKKSMCYEAGKYATLKKYRIITTENDKKRGIINMINAEAAEKVRNYMRQYIENKNEIDIIVNELKTLLNMSDKETRHLIELVSPSLEEDNSETLSNIRIFIEIVRPLLGDF